MSASCMYQAKSLSDNRGPRSASQTGGGKGKRSECRRYSRGALSRRTERTPGSQPLGGAKADGMGYRIGSERQPFEGDECLRSLGRRQLTWVSAGSSAGRSVKSPAEWVGLCHLGRGGSKRLLDAAGTGTLMRRLPEMLLERLPGSEAGRPLQWRAYPRFGRRRRSRLSKAH